MKYFILYISLICTLFCQSQDKIEAQKINDFKDCKNAQCQILTSYRLAEYYLEVDYIESSQKWLNVTKNYVNPKVIDTTACFINSLQSELFYYNRLFQFGKQEANKGILKAKKIKDSLLIADAYFFLGINQFELKEYQQALQSLLKSKQYYPSRKGKNYLRSTIQNEHIFNNIAQAKLKLIELDSAIFYNQKAYYFAVQNNSKRGIPNTEQTFGEIYLQKKQLDSAKLYLHKSMISAEKSKYFDIMLFNSALLMRCDPNNPKEIQNWFDYGLKLEKSKVINDAYKKYFYEIALGVFNALHDPKRIIICQEKIIQLDTKTRQSSDYYIQNFTNQQIKNESKLLSLQIDELKRKQNITFLQFLAASLLALLFLMLVFFIKRKNKETKTLLSQKNEISKDLHDDIGSGLSSILIHADLLAKNKEVPEKQRLLASKISETGKEISQRLNTFIWSLNVEHNSVQHFLEYVKHYAVNLFEGTEINFSFSEEIAFQNDIELNGSNRKNLFLCIKEILNNSIKHANATEVEIRIVQKDKNKLLIEIKDNGTGIKKVNFYGNGLKNIQKRVEDLNGNLTIQNDNGLLTQITIPIVF